MKYEVQYNPEFYNDIVQAMDWYEAQQRGLGLVLQQNVKLQTQKLSSTALQFAIKYDDVRCLKVTKFPYLIHYRVDEQTKTVKVEAMIHTSRNTDIWKERLTEH